MLIHRSVLCVLALLVAMPAEAGGSGRLSVRINTDALLNEMERSARVIAVVREDSATNQVERVEFSVKSDAGSADVTAVESNAYLHGAATLAALPKATPATLTVVLHDSASAPLTSFSGTLGTDGTVVLTADDTKDPSGGTDCASKTGCPDDTSDTSATAPDIEVLAAEVFAAAGGYELGLDLAGADTYEVAYAEVTVVESDEVTTCSKATGLCTTTGSTSTTTAEVGWDAIGAVWEAELTVEPEGVIDVKVKAFDANGRVINSLENIRSSLGAPWLDGGEGVNVLATDEDPLTGVGLMRRALSPGTQSVFTQGVGWAMVVNSGGWTSTTVPVDAKVELTDGDTITIPVNSYQRLSGDRQAFFDIFNDVEIQWRLGVGTVQVTGQIQNNGNLSLYAGSGSDLTTPQCSNGICVALIENSDGDYELAVSEYGSDATKLPDDLELTVTITDGSGEKDDFKTETVEFDDDITAVFANEISFSEDPIGLDLSGEVNLLGAADSKGKQKTLAKGKFYGSFSRDGDGDLNLAGADKNNVDAKGDILIGGEPIDFELTTDDNGDGVLNPPPLTPVFGNGSGTKNSASQNSGKPELL